MKNKRLEATLSALTPAIIGYGEGLPEVPPEKVAREAIAHFQAGWAELLIIIRVLIFVLNVVSLLSHGKLLKNVDREKQEQFMNKFMENRFLAIRGLAGIVRLPISMHYYTQDEVQLALGIDREALCADAEKHQVTR